MQEKCFLYLLFVFVMCEICHKGIQMERRETYFLQLFGYNNGI
jgi:hypothetical protein